MLINLVFRFKESDEHNLGIMYALVLLGAILLGTDTIFCKISLEPLYIRFPIIV